MQAKDLTALTDEELLKEAKKQKKIAITNAFIVGFLFGIILFSLVMNSWGFLTLIPLYLIYKFANQDKSDQQELERLLKERNLR